MEPPAGGQRPRPAGWTRRADRRAHRDWRWVDARASHAGATLVGPAAIVSGGRLEQSVGRHRRLEQPAPWRALCALADHRLGDEHPALGYDDADLSIAVGVLRAPP